jgi:hypothetical protein
LRPGERGQCDEPQDSSTAKNAETPSPEGLRDLLAHILAGAVGGSEAKWRGLIGEAEALPIVFHPRSNWRITPSGTAAELESIEKAAHLVRDAHPYVAKQLPDGA